MDITTYLPLISAVVVFLLGMLVLSKGKKEKLNTSFFLFAMSITIWMFGTFMMFINKDQITNILFWDKFIYVGVVFIPAIMLNYGLNLIHDQSKSRKNILIFGYSLSIFFLLLIPTRLFIDDAYIYQWGAHSKAQFFHHIFLLYFTTYIVYWFVIVYKYYISLKLILEKVKIKYCFFAFIILASIGSLGYLPAYGIGIYPFAYISGLIFTIILSYSIVAHRLMNIKFTLRKYTVFWISIAEILFYSVIIEYIGLKIFPNHPILIDVFVFITAITLYPSLRDATYKMANKYFFSSLYDSRELIASLSDKLRSTLDIKQIFEIITNTFNNALHPKAVAVLAYSANKGEYVVLFNSGFTAKVHDRFKGDHTLNRIFIKKNKAIVVEELRNTPYWVLCKELIDVLHSFGAEVLAPLNVKDKTIGIIALGAKESGDMYNDEDISVLEVAGAQIAIAVENALLYRETKEFGHKLEKKVNEATRELRHANQKLIKLDEAKSEFISIASHQLRTPLTVIKGYISMILENNFGELDEKKKVPLEKVFASNERLIQLVENLLNISRIESGRLQFNYAKIQLEDMVDSVVEELSQTAKKKGLKLVWTKPSTPLPSVNIDEEKVRQVAMNLTDNAIKYTKQGTVTVTIKQIDNELEFCVSDSGMGISEVDLPNLFQKFSRGTGTSLVHTEGTGLGLYVARQMIEAHQGKIWAESKGEGLGSKFCFRIPISK